MDKKNKHTEPDWLDQVLGTRRTPKELGPDEMAVAAAGLTHPDDAEAFALFKQFTAMEKSAKEAWEKANGPIKRSAAAQGERWDWLKDPWPWNYEHNEVK